MRPSCAMERRHIIAQAPVHVAVVTLAVAVPAYDIREERRAKGDLWKLACSVTESPRPDAQLA